MKQRGWFVFVGGAALALAGVYGMWAGWDIIQLERGWAQFIAGAVAVSGGAVTMALGRVIRAIGEAADGAARDASERQARPSLSQPPQEPKQSPEAPAKLEEAPPPKPRAIFNPAFRRPAPVEVDRYTMGDAEYVMFSDGSVELRSGGRVQRYPSIAALRADAASRRG